MGGSRGNPGQTYAKMRVAVPGPSSRCLEATLPMTDSNSQDDPRHPLASEPLGAFLTGALGCLVARLEPGGAIRAANVGFRQLVEGADAGSDWTAALPPDSRQCWQQTIEGLGPDDEPRVIDLHFGGMNPSTMIAIRCLIHQDQDGSIWLLGLPSDPFGLPRPEPGADLARRRRPSPSSHRWLRRQANRARLQAMTDPLTGLANRRQGDRWLASAVSQAQAVAGGSSLSLVMLDIDEFKTINDTFGHPIGDQVLRHASRVLAANIRPLDRLYRYGGEEFVVLLPGTDLQGGVALADRLRKRLSEPFPPPLERSLRASFGVASLKPGESAEALLQRADAALIRAKRLGRNRVEFDNDIG
ncbi:hypothetical protein BH23PLA1_BH23PLA1_19280 [soil metagenome]